jgi:hypothetical protein
VNDIGDIVVVVVEVGDYCGVRERSASVKALWYCKISNWVQRSVLHLGE